MSSQHPYSAVFLAVLLMGRGSRGGGNSSAVIHGGLQISCLCQLYFLFHTNRDIFLYITWFLIQKKPHQRPCRRLATLLACLGISGHQNAALAPVEGLWVVRLGVFLRTVGLEDLDGLSVPDGKISQSGVRDFQGPLPSWHLVSLRAVCMTARIWWWYSCEDNVASISFLAASSALQASALSLSGAPGPFALS